MRRSVFIGIWTLSLVSFIFSEAYAADLIVDTERSELVVRLFKGGVGAVLAHNHVVRASEFTGTARFDSDSSEASSVRIEVQTASLIADEDATRAQYGLTKSIHEKDRQKIQATMLSAEQLSVDAYPTIEFRSTRIEEQPDGAYNVVGHLTMHGVTRQVEFTAITEREGEALLGRAIINFKQSDFGIEPYKGMFGMIRNRDEARIHARIFFVPHSRGEEPG